MNKRKAKEHKEEKTENRIMSKLDAIEKRFNERIDAVESSLKKINESSLLTTEDQLFFGVVFTLLILFLELPEFDVCTVLESFGVVVEPTKGIITTKMILITLLILSGGARYLTALIKKDKERNKWRMVSVSFLMSCVYFLTYELTIRGLATVLTNVNVFLIFLSPVALTAIAFVIGVLVERKWYRVYGYDQAHGSIIFGFIGVTILVAYYVAMIVSLFTPISDLVSVIILLSSVFIVYLANKLSNFLHQRFKAYTQRQEGNKS